MEAMLHIIQETVEFGFNRSHGLRLCGKNMNKDYLKNLKNSPITISTLIIISLKIKSEKSNIIF